MGGGGNKKKDKAAGGAKSKKAGDGGRVEGNPKTQNVDKDKVEESSQETQQVVSNPGSFQPGMYPNNNNQHQILHSFYQTMQGNAHATNLGGFQGFVHPNTYPLPTVLHTVNKQNIHPVHSFVHMPVHPLCEQNIHSISPEASSSRQEADISQQSKEMTNQGAIQQNNIPTHPYQQNAQFNSNGTSGSHQELDIRQRQSRSNQESEFVHHTSGSSYGEATMYTNENRMYNRPSPMSKDIKGYIDASMRRMNEKLNNFERKAENERLNLIKRIRDLEIDVRRIKLDNREMDKKKEQEAQWERELEKRKEIERNKDREMEREKDREMEKQLYEWERNRKYMRKF